MNSPVQVAFGIMSATENPSAVAQLVQAIGAEHPVLIHHDFSKQPEFPIKGPNVYILPNPAHTGWGTWGFVQGVLQLMRAAFERTNCDYFQLLSGTCLPIRSIADLVDHLGAQQAPVHVDLMSLDEDANAMMTMGFRVFSPQGTMRFKVLKRMRQMYFGPDAQADLIHRSSLALLERPPHRRGRFYEPAQSLADLITRAARRGIGFRHPFVDGMKPYVGSTWFACRRDIGEKLLTRPSEGSLERFTRSLLACDEIYFPTIFGNLGMPLAPSNHFVSPFVGAHPKTMDTSDIEMAMASGRFFARKFSNDPADPARRIALDARQHTVPLEIAAINR